MANFVTVQNEEMIFFEPMRKTGRKLPLGDALFDFLELDLTKYNNVRNIVWDSFEKLFFYKDDINTAWSIYESFINSFPSTTNFFSEDNPPFYEKISKNRVESYFSAIATYLVYNLDIDTNIYVHPYICGSDTFIYGFMNSDPLEEFDNSLDLLQFQTIYKELVSKCFIDNDYGDDLTAKQKFHLYTILNSGKSDLLEITKGIRYALFYASESRAAQSEVCTKNKEGSVIDLVKYKEIVINCPAPLRAICETVNDFLFFEFNELLERDLKVKKCKNCGKYFILKGDYATDYCDRIPEGETQTCKRVAAIQARKEKVGENPILQEFQKAYKRNYARLASKRITQEEFRIWGEEATQKRDTISDQYMANPNEQLLIEFKQYLGNK